MITFIKQGIQSIKDTRKYAREKNVPNWYTQIISAVIIVFTISTLLTLSGILLIFSSKIDTHNTWFEMIGYSVQYYPFILTFGIMIRYGQYPIKLMILFTSYLQKLFMGLINKLDMLLWKKTGKDSLASSFILKHKKLVQLLMWMPLIITFIFNNFIR